MQTVTRSVDDGSKYVVSDEILRIFINKATSVVHDYVDRTDQRGHQIQNLLVMDPSTNDFPYLTILLLHRAGLHQEVIQYCTRSNLEHVRIFGDEIYQKVISLYGGRLP